MPDKNGKQQMPAAENIANGINIENVDLYDFAFDDIDDEKLDAKIAKLNIGESKNVKPAKDEEKKSEIVCRPTIEKLKIELQKIKQDNYGPNKPSFSNISLISMAILNNEHKMCTLGEIYNFITEYFEYYKEHPQPNSWQNSILHSLNSDDCFFNLPRTSDYPPNNGSFWTLRAYR